MLFIDLEDCECELIDLMYFHENETVVPTYKVVLKIDGKEDIFEIKKRYDDEGWLVENFNGQKYSVTVNNFYGCVKIMIMKMGFTDDISQGPFQEIYGEMYEEHTEFGRELESLIHSYREENSLIEK